MLYHATAHQLAKFLFHSPKTVAMYDGSTHCYHVFRRISLTGDSLKLAKVLETGETFKSFQGWEVIQQNLEIPLQIEYSGKSIFVGYDEICEEWFGFTAFHHINLVGISDEIWVRYQKYNLNESLHDIFEYLV